MKIVDTGTLVGDVVVGSVVVITVVSLAIGFMVWVLWKSWRGE